MALTTTRCPTLSGPLAAALAKFVNNADGFVTEGQFPALADRTRHMPTLPFPCITKHFFLSHEPPLPV